MKANRLHHIIHTVTWWLFKWNIVGFYLPCWLVDNIKHNAEALSAFDSDGFSAFIKVGAFSPSLLKITEAIDQFPSFFQLDRYCGFLICKFWVTQIANGAGIELWWRQGGFSDFYRGNCIRIFPDRNFRLVGFRVYFKIYGCCAGFIKKQKMNVLRKKLDVRLILYIAWQINGRLL